MDSSSQQITKRLSELHKQMRDPIEQERRQLKIKQKQNVENTTRRYGLS